MLINRPFRLCIIERTAYRHGMHDHREDMMKTGVSLK